MKTGQIRELISNAIAIEEQTHNLENTLDTVTRMRGLWLTDEQRNGVLQFVQDYIEHAPALLDHITDTARKAGFYGLISHILDEAEQYFLQPFDLIPDHLGLLGLIDDAYVVHRIIQELSNRFQRQAGYSLVPSDLTNANLLIRNLIGEPHASTLDNAINLTLSQPLIQQSVQKILNSGFFINVPMPDPIWGNASIDDIVNTQLGVMGIF